MTETAQGFSDEKIADKIEKMRVKAEHANTTETERNALLEMIGRWMEKYRIDQARIDLARLKSGKTGEAIVDKFITVKGTYADGYATSFHQIISVMDGLKTIRVKKATSTFDYHIIGYESDVDQAILLLQSIQLQAATQLESWIRTQAHWYALTPMQKFKERRSYIVFFGVGAGKRIKEAQDRLLGEEEAREPGTELMLRDRGALVDSRYGDLYPNARKLSGRKQYTGRGAAAGEAAGRRADTGDKRVGDDQRRRLT